MSSKNKMSKQNKAVFTIVTDRICEDSQENFNGEAFAPAPDLNLLGFEFPLNYEIEEIHQTPSASSLSAYITHLQDQVKSITNKIQFEYHQARETVLLQLCQQPSVGQSTNLSKQISRKKIDDEFVKMGIVRKYDPKLRICLFDKLGEKDNDDEEALAKDAGDLAIDLIKRKVQIDWEANLSDELEKERRRLREIQKKRQKDLQQIDKDFEKMMKKRKSNRQLQAQYKSKQSLNSIQNADSLSNKTPKKIQKKQKSQRKASERNMRQNMSKGSRQRQSVQESEQVESCSVMNENQGHGEMIGMEESNHNMKINLLEESQSNQQWQHREIEKPNGIEFNSQVLESGQQ